MQSNSEITTQQGAAGSATGTQHGGHGLATLIGSGRPPHADPALAADILRSSPVFSARLPASTDEADQVDQAIAYLSIPAPRKWIAGRVLTLLSQYFAPNMDEKISAAIADDWCEMLAEYPAWSIANACRWWMGRENQHKHRRPLPGDIQERAWVEMERIRAAKIVLDRGAIAIDYVPRSSPRPVRDDPEAMEARRAFAAEVLRDFTNKGAAA